MRAVTMSPPVPQETSEQYMERQKLRDLVFGFMGLIESLKAEADLYCLEAVAVAAEGAIDRITVEFPYELRQLNYYEAEQVLWSFRRQFRHHMEAHSFFLTVAELRQDTKEAAAALHHHYTMACGSESYDAMSAMVDDEDDY